MGFNSLDCLGNTRQWHFYFMLDPISRHISKTSHVFRVFNFDKRGVPLHDYCFKYDLLIIFNIHRYYLWDEYEAWDFFEFQQENKNIPEDFCHKAGGTGLS